jgi:hypothetical protein
MSKFDIKDVWSSQKLQEEILNRVGDWFPLEDFRSTANNIEDPPFGIPTNVGAIDISGVNLNRGRNVSDNSIVEIGFPPCYELSWSEFPGNVLYFDDTPVDLPKTGKWKYRLPITYDVAKKTLQVPNITFPNVDSVKIEDKSRGGFRLNDHYFIRSNGEVWIKGSRPYLNLSVIVNWKDNSNAPNTTRIDIPPDDFILNGELVSTSNDKVRVPYRPCFKGFEAIYNVYNYELKIFRKSVCNPGFGGIYGYDVNEILDPFTNTFKEGIFQYETISEVVRPVTYKPAGFEGRRQGFEAEIDDPGETRIVNKLIYIGGLSPSRQSDWKNLYDKGLWPDPNNHSMTQNTFFVSMSLDTKVTQIKEYTEQTRFSDLVDCECVELNIITPPTVNRLLSPDCDCTVTVSEETYVICPDSFTEKAYDEFLSGRQTPPQVEDLLDKNSDNEALIPTYRRIITADPCDFGDASSRIWQNFANRDVRDIVKNEIDGLFDGQESISCYATSSVQSQSTKTYYYDITDCNICEVSKSYFSVSFGHYAGSGSAFESFEDEDSPSKSIFSQYKLKNLDSFSENFEYYKDATLYSSSMVYVMTFDRDSMKDRIDPGNFEINLSELNGLSYANNVYTGSNVAVSSSNKVLSLVDNSGDLTEIESCSDKAAIYSFDIVSGSLSGGIHSSGVGTPTSNVTYKTYGKVYPNSGVIVLDAEMLNSELNFNTVSGSNTNGDNAYKIFTSLSGSAAIGKPSKFRNSRQRNIRNYSVRIAPVECNYSNNPTYLKEYGRIKHSCFIENPVTYITSVGLYTPARELVAIAKLSKPIKKTKDDTVDIKIRLGL